MENTAVADYMHRRNMLASNMARIISAQLLIAAVFPCAYLILQNYDLFGFELYIGRLVVKIALAMFTIALMFAGVIVVKKYFATDDMLPDETDIRDGSEVVSQAYSIARDALIYNMTISAVVLAVGAIASLVVMIVTPNVLSGACFAKTIFMISISIAFLFFYPSCDRLRCYKDMLFRKFINQGMGCAAWMTFSVMMPLSTAIFLFWRYFGDNNRTIAWIVYPVALVLWGAIVALSDYNNGNKTLDID